MKCQNCGKQEVNVHYSSNINGHVTERYLCSECAEQMGYNYQSVFGDNFMNGYIPGSFPMMGSVLAAIPAALGFLTPVRFTAVPQMGILVRNQVSAQDTEEIPPQETCIDGDMKKRRELNVLREQMRKAAEAEDFEKAIELRGKIKEIEKQA